MSDFRVFQAAVQARFAKLQRFPLFRVDLDRDLLWSVYLDSFPAGTNPIFRERREYDCNCCKNFIRKAGPIVAIDKGKVRTLWNLKDMDHPTFSVVAKALHEAVKNAPILGPLLSDEATLGTAKTFDALDSKLPAWNHFHASLPRNYVESRHNIPSKLGDMQSTHDVLMRALSEIDLDTVDQVLDLIAQNSIYRGEEHKPTLTAFRKIKEDFRKLGKFKSQAEADRVTDLFVWERFNTVSSAVARIRNSVIGTLLVDLAEGKEMEDAVKAYEVKVAPANYKRPTALVTPAMIKQAKQKIEDLNLTSALERRYATIDDLTINDILFADRAIKRLNKSVLDDLMDTTSAKAKAKNLDKVEEITIEKFVKDVLPTAKEIEVLFEGRHASNLVSLIAPVDPTAGSLFKWNNKFSWSYNGDLADSNIKERVKKAGGSVVGDLCCRLAWYNYDDLDFHMKEPGGYEIYYGNKRMRSPCGGVLDVDMNAGHGSTREPVENIYYANHGDMRNGTYELLVHQFCYRESSNTGFDVEIDWQGDVRTYHMDTSPRTSHKEVTVALIHFKNGTVTIEDKLPSGRASKTIWGIDTNSFHRCKLMCLSPNHWEGEKGVGNKHYFFMLDNCANEGQARGFYNEFLNSEFDKHRKVFEIVGSKVKTDIDERQLSGLGFSSTKNDTLTVRVKGSFNRTLKVVF